MKYKRLLSATLAFVLTASLCMTVSATELSVAVTDTVSGSDIAEAVVEVEEEEVVQEETLETFNATQAEIDEMKTVLQLNTATEGALSVRTEDDWYSFEITEPGYFQVELKASANADVNAIKNGWNMYIYKQGDFSSNIKGYERITTSCTSAALPMGKGTYYVLVRANSNSLDSMAPVNCPYEITAKFVASDVWESENNDTNATPNVIAANKNYSGVLHNRQDVDWYKVNITTQGYFQVQLTVPNTVNVDDIHNGWGVTIHDKDLNVIGTYTDIKGNYTTAECPFAKGEYYIKVQAKNSNADSFAPLDCIYNLNVKTTTTTVWESEYNDTNATADVISPNKKYSGTLYKAKDVDWYKVNVTTQGYFQVQFIVANTISADDINNGWQMAIYDKDLNEIKKYNRIESSTTSHILPYAKGTYYVKIWSVSDWQDAQAPVNCVYGVNVKAVKNNFWESEYNNTFAKADSITLGKKYSGITTYCDDEDYYKVTVPATGVLEVKFKSLSGAQNSIGVTHWGWNVYVYQGTNKSVASYTDVKASQTVKLDVKKGTYYIYIRPNSYTNSYAPMDCQYSLSTKYSKAPAAVTLSSATGGKKQVTLKWKKVANATGYEIYRSTSKNGTYKKVATIKKAATVKYVDKKLKAKTTYYYKIQAYTTTNSLKAYGKFSKVKSAKTSK